VLSAFPTALASLSQAPLAPLAQASDSPRAVPFALVDAAPAPFLWRLDVRDASVALLAPTLAVQKGNLVRLVMGSAAAVEEIGEGAVEEAEPSGPSDTPANPGSVPPEGVGAPGGAGASLNATASSLFGSQGDVDWTAIDAAEAAARAALTIAPIGPPEPLLSEPGLGRQGPAAPNAAVPILPPPIRAGDVRRQRLLVQVQPPRFWRQPRLPWTLAAPAASSSAGPGVPALPSVAGYFSAAERVSPAASGHSGALVASLHATSDPAIAALQRRFSESLNADQRAAVCKIVSARDYCCVIGMPGTGKTSTLSLAVQALVAQGRSVLIASHTHSAVDTLLAKLAQDGVDVLRIGNPSSVSAEVRPRCLDACIASGELPTVGHVRYRVMTAPVVGVTCLGVDGHPLFALRSFDIAICDEAGQIPEPIVLGPIRCARAFVLVGDHAQLPPLVTSSAAEAAGYGVSLLRRLAEAHPSACATLRIQYRMNAEIQSIANTLVYGGQLQCATEAVATQRYRLPGAAAGAPLFGHPPYAVSTSEGAAGAASVTAKLHSPPWLQRALDLATTVLFIDTDALLESFLSAREERPRGHSEGAGRPAECGACACAAAAAASGCDAEGSVCNLVEARAVTAIATAVLFHGGCGRDMGVIAPFNAQTGAVRAHLAAAGKGWAGVTGVTAGGELARELRCVEVETIDRYQGRDKEVILFSFTRGLRWIPGADAAAPAAAAGGSAGDTGRLGGVLESLPRLNVAFTRAKKKLLMVGSASTLRRGSALCAEVLRLCEARGWVCALPPIPAVARGVTAAAVPAGVSSQPVPHPFHVAAACYCSCSCHRLYN
jgi:hypothetical protein